MICRRWNTFDCFGLVATLAWGLSAAPFDETIRAQIEKPVVVADSPQKPGIKGFTLRYNLRLVNGTEASIEIPDLDKRSDHSLIFLSLQWQQADGSWEYIVPEGMVVFINPTHFAPCRPLGANQAQVFNNMASRFVLQGEQLPPMGSQITVRAALTLTCNQPPSKTVITTPFALSLPP